ncbi:MAG: MFS transporter [Chloroflexota bacterium]|nr:MFS transporter [Chloroflexota bacterium]MDP6757672.1 MFS transporter [Chloroflexota bacterium]
MSALLPIISSPSRPGRAFLPVLLLATYATVILRRIYGPIPHLIATDFDITVGLVAQMMTIETLLSIIAAFLLAPLSDRLGRRRAALAAVWIRVLGSAIVVTAPSFGILAFGTAFLGIGNGIIFPQLFSSVADVYEPPLRDRRIALVSTTSRVGFITAPLLGGFLAGAFDWRAAFLAGAALTVVAALAMTLFLPEVHRRDIRRVSFYDLVFAGTLRALRNHFIVRLLLANFIFVTGGYGVDSFLGAFAADAYGLEPAALGMLVAVGPVMSVFGVILGGRLPAALRIPVLVTSSILFAVPAFLLFTFPFTPLFMAFMSGIWGFGNGLRITAVWSLLIDIAADDRGAVTGLAQVSFSAGIMLGSAAGGLILNLVGFTALGWFLAFAAAASAVLFLLLARRPAA